VASANQIGGSRDRTHKTVSLAVSVNRTTGREVVLSFGSEPGGCSLKSSWFLDTSNCPVTNSPRLLELLETVVESSHHGVSCITITEWRIL
jgi:hypothetical protein